MRSKLERIAAAPAGAAALALTGFALVFLALGQSVPMTFAAFAVASLGLVILVRPEYGVHFLVLHTAVGFAQYFELPRFGPVSIPIALEGVLLLAFLVQLSFFRKRLYLNFAENWLLGGYTLLLLLSMALADHLGPENLAEFRSVYLIVILVYFLFTNLVDSRAGFVRMLATLVVADAILITSGLLNYAGLLEPRSIDPMRIQGRTVGFIGNPNSLAYVLIGLFPFVLGLAFYVQRRWLRRLLLLLAAGNLFVILNTLSRGGFIALVCVVLLMAFRLSRDRRLVALLLLLGIVAYLLLPAALFDRFEEVRSLRGNDRYLLTIIGAEMAMDNPVLGVGYGNFRRYFPRYDVLHRGGATAPHNLYTSIAAQTGIPSLILYLLIMTFAWRRLNRIRRSLPGQPTDLADVEQRNQRFLLLVTTALQANILNTLVFGLTSHVEHEYLNFAVLAMTVVLDRIHGAPEAAAQQAPALPTRIAVREAP